MPSLPDYKEAIKAYGRGFVAGVCTGIIFCLIMAKAWFFVPLLLGLLFGGIAFDRKINQDGK
jgi:hypothetical protein